MKTYTLPLPVWKQGDDLASCLEANDNHSVKSLMDLAEQYKCAAELCQRVAGRLSETNLDEVSIQGQTHMIWVEAPEDVVASLVADKLLVEEIWDDEEEDEEIEEDTEEDNSSN